MPPQSGTGDSCDEIACSECLRGEREGGRSLVVARGAAGAPTAVAVSSARRPGAAAPAARSRRGRGSRRGPPHQMLAIRSVSFRSSRALPSKSCIAAARGGSGKVGVCAGRPPRMRRQQQDRWSRARATALAPPMSDKGRTLLNMRPPDLLMMYRE
jgi:hypothetical protein